MQLRRHDKALAVALLKRIELLFDPVHRKFREQGGCQRLAGGVAHKQVVVADIDGHFPQVARKSFRAADDQRALRVGKEFLCIDTSALHADLRGIGADVVLDSLGPRHIDSILSIQNQSFMNGP